MDLGATEWTTFRKITLPMIAPGVAAAALLAAALSVDDYVITRSTPARRRRSRCSSSAPRARASRPRSTCWPPGLLFVVLILLGLNVVVQKARGGAMDSPGRAATSRRRRTPAMRSVEIPDTEPPEVLRVVERPDPVAGAGRGPHRRRRLRGELRRHDGADRAVRRRAEAADGRGLRGRRDDRRGRRRRRCGARGRARDGRHAVRRLRVAGRRVPAADAIPLADRLSFEQGAAIPVNYATAWAGLSDTARCRPGRRSSSRPPAGGVGIAATQIAKRVGAEVWGTASPASTTRSAATASTTRSTTAPAAGGRGCRRSISSSTPSAAPVPALLRDAARRRPAGRLRRLVGRPRARSATTCRARPRRCRCCAAST